MARSVAIIRYIQDKQIHDQGNSRKELSTTTEKNGKPKIQWMNFLFEFITHKDLSASMIRSNCRTKSLPADLSKSISIRP
jgi:hypothetical protein